MVIAEPADPYGLWQQVSPLVGGWPDSDEDRLDELATGWQQASADLASARDFDAAPVLGVWTDDAGTEFHDRTVRLGARAGALSDGMQMLARQSAVYAGEVKWTKNAIVQGLQNYLPAYAESFAFPDAVAKPVRDSMVAALAAELNAAIEGSAQRVRGAGGAPLIRTAGAEPAGEDSGDSPWDVIGDIGEVVGEAGEAIGEAGEAIGEVAGEVGEGAGEIAGGVLEGPGEALDEVGEAAGEIGDEVGEGAGEVGDEIGEGAGEIGEAADDIGGGDEPAPYQSPAPGTPEHQARVAELAQDPAHKGATSAKTVREAEVGLDLERRGDLPGPITRTPLDNSDPAFQRDRGDFTDSSGQRWDVKTPVDTFPRGPRAGQPLPPGQPGSYDGSTVEAEIEGEFAEGQYVIIDAQNLSPAAEQDLRDRVADHPEWEGRILWH